MKRKIKAGTTGHIEHIAIDDNSATDGSGLTGVAYNAAGLTAKYKRTGQATWTAITLATATVGTWTSGGFVESDSGAGGEYELHIPDAVLAAGAVGAVVVIYGAASMAPVRIEYELDAVDYQDASDFGLSSLDGHTPQTGDAYARLGAPAAASIAADIAALVDEMWDEILTGATHNVPGSAGRRLRELGTTVILTGIAQAGTLNSITLDTAASATDSIYVRNIIAILAGTGAGQARIVIEYHGTPKVAFVDRDWTVIPDATSEYQMTAFSLSAITEHGTAQAGGASDITFAATASSQDDIHKDSLIVLATGPGAGQCRHCDGYNGTTKVASVSPPWVIQPTVATVYKVIPGGEVNTNAASRTASKADVSGLSTAAKLQRFVSLLARSDPEAAADLAAELAEINADYGSGGGDYAAGDSQEGIRDGVSTIPTTKIGYKLASDGLDSISITSPVGVASNFREMMVQVWRRFFKKVTKSDMEIKTYTDDGNVLTTQKIAQDGNDQTQESAV